MPTGLRLTPQQLPKRQRVHQKVHVMPLQLPLQRTWVIASPPPNARQMLQQMWTSTHTKRHCAREAPTCAEQVSSAAATLSRRHGLNAGLNTLEYKALSCSHIFCLSNSHCSCSTFWQPASLALSFAAERRLLDSVRGSSGQRCAHQNLDLAHLSNPVSYSCTASGTWRRNSRINEEGIISSR